MQQEHLISTLGEDNFNMILDFIDTYNESNTEVFSAANHIITQFDVDIKTARAMIDVWRTSFRF